MAEKVSKGQKTRDLLIRQAIHLMARNGYSEVSFQMIAKACNVSQGAPRYHFKTKINLFVAMVEKIIARRNGLVENLEDISDNAYDGLVKFMRGNITWALLFTAEAEVFSLLYYFAAIDPVFSELYGRLALQELKRIEAALLSGQREKIFFFREPSSVIAKIFYDYMVSQWISLLSGRNLNPKKVDIEMSVKLLIKKMTGYEDD